MKPGELPPYEITHTSVLDGSPAMVLSVRDGHSYVLMNEDGDTWVDPIVQWKRLR